MAWKSLPVWPRRRWFRFGLRAMFVGVALLTPFLAWYSAQLRWRDQRFAEINHFRPSARGFIRAPTFGLRFIRQVGIEHLFVRVDSDEEEARARRLDSLFPEAEIHIERAK